MDENGSKKRVVKILTSTMAIVVLEKESKMKACFVMEIVRSFGCRIADFHIVPMANHWFFGAIVRSFDSW